MILAKAKHGIIFKEKLSAAILSNSTRKLLWFELRGLPKFLVQLFEIISLCNLP